MYIVNIKFFAYLFSVLLIITRKHNSVLFDFF